MINAREFVRTCVMVVAVVVGKAREEIVKSFLRF